MYQLTFQQRHTFIPFPSEFHCPTIHQLSQRHSDSPYCNIGEGNLHRNIIHDVTNHTGSQPTNHIYHIHLNSMIHDSSRHQFTSTVLYTNPSIHLILLSYSIPITALQYNQPCHPSHRISTYIHTYCRATMYYPPSKLFTCYSNNLIHPSITITSYLQYPTILNLNLTHNSTPQPPV